MTELSSWIPRMENNKDNTVELVFISCMILLQWQKFRNKLEVVENISLM